jgi:hypothetical protein
MSGLVIELDDALTEYRDPDHDPLWQLVVSVVRTLPVKQTAAGTGLSERTVKRARAGQRVRRDARDRLADYAVEHARSTLRAQGIRPPIDREALLATYIDRHP